MKPSYETELLDVLEKANATRASALPKIGSTIKDAQGRPVIVTAHAGTATDGTPLVNVLRTRRDGRQQHYLVRLEASEAGQREGRDRRRQERQERARQRMEQEHARARSVNVLTDVTPVSELPQHFTPEEVSAGVTADKALDKQLEQQRALRAQYVNQTAIQFGGQRRPITVTLPDEIKRFNNRYFNEREPESQYNRRYNTMFDYQIKGAEQILTELQNRDQILLGDSPGLGKTAIALATIKKMKTDGKKRFLVVVPTRGIKALKASWKDEAAAFGLETKGIKELTSESPDSEGIYVIGYNELNKISDEEAYTFDYSVFDEIHNAATENTKSTKNVLKVMEKCSKVLTMSATPFTDVSEMKWFEKSGLFESFGGFENFKKKFSYRKKRNEDIESSEAKILQQMSKLNALLTEQGYMILRKTNLRGLHNVFGTQKLTAEQNRQLQKGAEVFAFLKQHAQGGITSMFIGAMFAGWYRHFLEYVRIPLAVAIAKNALKEGKQPAIFTAYNVPGHSHMLAAARKITERILRNGTVNGIVSPHAVTQAQQIQRQVETMMRGLPEVPPITKELVKRLGGESVVAEVHGSTKKNSVSEQKLFQSGERKVLVASMAKGGTGLSFHDARGDAPRVQINLTLPYSDKEYEQVVGRTHRLTPDLRITDMYWLQTDSDLDAREAARIGNRLSAAGALQTANPVLNHAVSTLYAGGNFQANTERPAAVMELLDWDKMGERFRNLVFDLNQEYGERLSAADVPTPEARQPRQRAAAANG